MNGSFNHQEYREDMSKIWTTIDEIRKLMEAKISWLVFWSIVTFFGLIIIGFFGYVVQAQNALNNEFSSHEQAQFSTEKTDIQWKASIDNRLGNIEKALNISNVVKK